MRKAVLFVAIVSLLLFPLSSTSMSGEPKKDSGKDTAMDKCVKKDLKDTSVVIGDTIADPGGLKRKSAKERCTYEKAKNPKEFKQKYGGGGVKFEGTIK